MAPKWLVGVHVAVVLDVQVFERILYIWAIRHPASGYVQGINDLVTPFFVVFLSEYLADGQSSLALPLAISRVSWLVAFSALTLLVGQQEGYPTC